MTISKQVVSKALKMEAKQKRNSIRGNRFLTEVMRDLTHAAVFQAEASPFFQAAKK